MNFEFKYLTTYVCMGVALIFIYGQYFVSVEPLDILTAKIMALFWILLGAIFKVGTDVKE